jgi:hypothetical protein
VWAVSRTVVSPELTLGAARCRYFAGHDERSLFEPRLRGIVFADDPAGCRVLVECIAEKA